MRTLWIAVSGLSSVATLTVLLSVTYVIILATRPNDERLNRLVFNCHEGLAYAASLFSIVFLGSLISIAIP